MSAFVAPGFHWDRADAYLFDIDGTLVRSRDPVHYFAFQHATRHVFGLDATMDGVPVQGNTDVGILRAVLQKKGLANHQIDAGLPQLVEHMCAEVRRNASQMSPELCPSIRELVSLLHSQGKLLGAASGNLETIGWLKLERAGLRHMFAFGSFSHPLEFRADIFRQGVEAARRRLGLSATVYAVGDTPADIEAAGVVGIPIIAVATGSFQFDQLLALQPDACFRCATDMLKNTPTNNC
ncbi:MAG TPA: HAD family hydrolase [Candidatus Angelobacter sp.]|nr:HAD family hydrolase [Candidatus Angelobacter sp.]